MHPALPLAVLTQLGLFAPSLRALDGSPQTGYRLASLTVAPGSKSGFTLVSPQDLGIDFTNSLSPQRAQLFQNSINGSGLAAADVDGDGLVDLYFCHKQAANQLYRSLGQGRFTNITAQAGVGCTHQISVGAVFGDLNGDRAPDLVVSAFGGPNTLLLNDGHGRFTDVTAASGIAGKSGATSMALADLDGDGDLDLYLCNFAVQAILRDGGLIATRIVNGQPQVTGRYAHRLKIIEGMLFELGEPDTLFLNDGQAHFTPVPWEKSFTGVDGKPMSPPLDFGLAVQIRDANGDGFPDIYVCNDFQTPDRLWLGDGRGQFREASLLALRNMSYASMGVDFADLDRDGRYEFITVEMLSESLPKHLRTSSPMGPVKRIPGDWAEREQFARNCLYSNRGDGTWAEIANFAGVTATGWSWAPLFLDVDLDGWEDLLVSNGHLHDVNNRDVGNLSRSQPGQNLQNTKDKFLQFPKLESAKFAFRNRRDLTFEDTSATWGFHSTRIAHGLISVDYDADGDLDVLLNALDGPPLIYRNDSAAPRVAVRLKGLAPNTEGIGAQLVLKGGPVTQRQEMVIGGQYLSHSQTQRTFAAGSGEMELEVHWRSGRRSTLQRIRANHLYEVDEAGATAPPKTEAAPTPKPWFADVSERLGHEHPEPAHNDLAVQPLLPQLYSQLGPGVAWLDLNGDTHLDLFIGAGKGGSLGAFWGNGQGTFTRAAVGGAKVTDDLTGVAAWVGSDGQRRLLGGVANYESYGVTSSPAVLSWSAVGQICTAASVIPGNQGSPGGVTVGDVDGDGDLDVFVGNRIRVGRWPESGGSRFFRNDQGTLVAEDSAAFAKLGPVSDALLVNLDGEGPPELVVAVELGPLRIYSRLNGAWSDQTESWGLAGLTGWWNSVATGDFDGDGRLDLIAGNRGLNTSWQRWNQGHPHLVWTEVDGQSPLLVVEAAVVGAQLQPLRDRNQLSIVLPDLLARIPTHSAYSEASVRSILGESANRAQELQASTLASLILLNRGGHFETRPLTRDAQWSPAYGLAVADFDADGHQDLVIAQNLFSVRPDDSRLDAGRGLLLRGDGTGGLTALSSQESGIAVYGEQRGAAAADFDEDGRVDLVMSQNGSKTVLLHNVATRAGLRVRLAGPPGNPDGVGAVLVPRRNQSSGAAQVVTGGGGYWSQAGPVLVVGGERPTTVEVRWPDGRISRVGVPTSGVEVAVNWSTATRQ